MFYKSVQKSVRTLFVTWSAHNSIIFINNILKIIKKYINLSLFKIMFSTHTTIFITTAN